jgi:hypothetical protein
MSSSASARSLCISDMEFFKFARRLRRSVLHPAAGTARR